MARSVARSALAAAALASAGCPYVAEGELRVAGGSTTIGPGTQLTLLLYCDRLFTGWELAAGGAGCAGSWQLAGPAAGTITACGVYTAPAERPAVAPVVTASECPSIDCADACSAGLTLDLSGYDAAPP